MMSGRFIAVVGPSGVGKDTVMDAICAKHPQIQKVRRVITRDPLAGGEDAHTVSVDVFEANVAAGAFALHWEAHGLRYGIPATVDEALAEGRDVLANLSRSVLPQLEGRFAQSMIILLTASPEVLASRLAKRGRETAEDQAKRLQRATFTLAPGLTPVEIRNDGALGATLEAFEAAVYAERG